MTNSTNLALPYIGAAQAQKHVTHNEALQIVDALVHFSVAARDQTAPPPTPGEGLRLLVGFGASGAFAGKENQAAVFLAGAWAFLAPRAGWRVFVEAEGVLLIWDGAAWNDAGLSLRALRDLSLLGLGAAADAINPLTAKLNRALFTAKYVAEGGTGDLRLTLNKESAGAAASQLYQTNYSGRAEIGLAGDDNFHVKVSPNGSAWTEAIVIDKTSGNVGVKTAAPTAPLTVSGNTATPQSPSSGTLLHVAGADAVAARVTIDGYGAVAQTIYRRAGGTAANPSALGASNTICQFAGYGYGATGYSAAGRALILINTAEAWSDTAQGTFVSIYTTAKTTTTTVEKVRITDAGDMGIGVTAPTATLHVSGAIRTGSYTVATLPSASASGAGARAFVTDANATTFAAVAAGGGANGVPVYSDGTNWRIG